MSLVGWCGVGDTLEDPFSEVKIGDYKITILS